MAELILIRHAEAEEIKTSDLARRLTQKGQKQAKYLAQVFTNELDHVDLFVHSGITRAEQTLKLIIGSKENWNVMTTSSLKHEGKAVDLGKWLKLHADELSKVVVVGHEPQLSRFVAWAVARSNQAQLKIKKGGIVRLQIVDFSVIMKTRMILTELTSIKKIKSATNRI
ncbi:MAG: histidine phosphatase family protein [Bdellovibrio sp.]|nr:histidine phosphatase family protein [Bdellovibrio sp.]